MAYTTLKCRACHCCINISQNVPIAHTQIDLYINMYVQEMKRKLNRKKRKTKIKQQLGISTRLMVCLVQFPWRHIYYDCMAHKLIMKWISACSADTQAHRSQWFESTSQCSVNARFMKNNTIPTIVHSALPYNLMYIWVKLARRVQTFRLFAALASKKRTQDSWKVCRRQLDWLSFYRLCVWLCINGATACASCESPFIAIPKCSSFTTNFSQNA